MNPTLARHCKNCKEYSQIEIIEDSPVICPKCNMNWGKVGHVADIFDYCPICQCRQFYVTKDFNQFGGCLIVLIGIILVPWTYGLSLPVFALIDWLIYRRVPSVIACYKCGSEFRHIPNSKNFKPFMHHIGLKYDKYR